MTAISPFPTSMIDATSLGLLLPMSVALRADGDLMSAGPTLRKLIGHARNFDEAFEIARPIEAAVGFRKLRPAIGRGDRLFLRLRGMPATVLRGHGILLHDGAALLNLGFGVGLSDAVRAHDLTDADFAPSELAMELLFLHEANLAVQRELAGFTSRLDQARRAAEREAFTDPLTGLDNRRGLDEALRLAVANVEHTPFALGHLDLDHFKTVNDVLGHAGGDSVLRSVGQILRQEVRAGDAVARVGGDEFVLLLQGAIDENTLFRLGRRIITRIENCLPKSETLATISASIGFAMAGKGSDGDGLLAEADTALYRAKRNGRGRVEMHR